MQTRALGRTDLRLSEITLGTGGLAEQAYGAVTQERFEEVVRAAIDAGITTFDVAPLWGDGGSERTVGRLIAEAGIEAVVITRAGVQREGGKVRQSFAPDALVAECEASLERLGREQIDVWLLHSPGEHELRRGEIEEAIERLESSGKIRAWGVSASDASEARLAIDAGAQAVCLPYNLLVPNEVEDLATDLARAGCGVLARSPLAYGLLAGQWSDDRIFAPEDHRARRWSQSAFAERIRQVNALRFLVGAEHRDLATAALRFVLTHPSVATAIVGARTPLQVAAAAEAAGGRLGDDDVLRLVKVRDSAGI